MRNNIMFLLFFVLPFYSCNDTKDTDNNEEISFDSIVDTTFISNISIDEEKYLFIKHTHTDAFSRRPSGSDSIIFGFSLFFETESKESIIISISEDFNVDELGLQFEGNSKSVSNNYLPSQAFIDIFSKKYFDFAKFRYMDNGGYWSDYYETSATHGMGLNWFQNVAGASICFEDQAELYDTKYLGASISEDSINTLYSKSYFEITNLTVLNECNLIIEGSFESYIYSYYGIQLHLKCDYFKGYVGNVIQPCP